MNRRTACLTANSQLREPSTGINTLSMLPPAAALGTGGRLAAAGAACRACAAFAERRRKKNLTTSIAMAEAKKNGSIISQSSRVSGTVSKNGCRNGTYTTTSTSSSDAPTAHTIHLLENTPIEKIEL